MSEPVFFFDAEDPDLFKACLAARVNFRYFWRELSWERRRIVPALGLAMIKIPFTDGPRADGNAEFEHMWVGDIEFDGDSLKGKLLNSPDWLSSVRQGDGASVPFSHITDWMISANGQAYGGFTVNLMRARMGSKARDNHDLAWGLTFGDPDIIRVEIEERPKPRPRLIPNLFGRDPRPPEPFHDHTMCKDRIPKIQAQLQADPGMATSIDERGWSVLHHEALAGNLGVVKLLIEHGADPAVRTPNGHTATDLARKIGWEEIANFIEQ